MILLVIMFGLLLCLSFGYSAFSTNISFNTKGNVYKVSDKCYMTKDNGDGSVTITGYDKSCGNDVNIPSTIKGLIVSRAEKASFKNKGLTSITLPNTIKYIGTDAFTGNDLTEVEIPSSVTTIDNYAFRNMKIRKLILHDGVQYIGVDAFQGNDLTEINIPKSVTYLGGGSFAANAVTGNDAFIYGRNADGSINYTVLNSYAGKDATGTTIPDTVTVLGIEAYYTVKYLEIDIPSRIKIIPSLCFGDSHATKVTLHDGLEEIRGGAFINTAFSLINIPSTVNFIDKDAFTCPWCDDNSVALKKINVNKKSGSLEGAPWGAVNATVNWTGDN